MAAEKRSFEEDGSFKSSAFILDIEGTTTSISFVKDTLFPYVKENLKAYVKENWSNEEFQQIYASFIEQSEQDEANKVEGVILLKKDEENAEENFVKNVLWQMDSDRKTGCLKKLQGRMYVTGYNKGELKGHVYPDFVPALKKWNTENKSVFIYSSGSIEAQKLLFGHSVDGDLTEYIKDYFDTEIGAKTEKDSYINIAKKIEKEVSDITFFTDVVKEAEAAKEAGLKVVLVQRETTDEFAADIKEKFEIIKTFNIEECDKPSPSKKRKIEEEEEKIPKINIEEVADEKKDETTKPEVAKVEEKTPVVEEPKTEEPEKMETEDTKKVEEEVAKTVDDEVAEDLTVNGDKQAETNGHTNGLNGHTNGDTEKSTNEKKDEIEPIPVKKLDTEVTPAGDVPVEPVATE